MRNVFKVRILRDICIATFALNSLPILCQDRSFFDVTPVLGGLDEQGQGWIVIPDTDFIYMLGDLIDAESTPGDTVIRPFFCRFNYEGQMQEMRVLYDSLAAGEFRINTRPVLKTNGTLLGYFDLLDSSMCCYHACMVEMDNESGTMLRYKRHPLLPTMDSSDVGGYFTQDANGNSIAYHSDGHGRIYIRKINPHFEIDNEILVEDNGIGNFPKYIEADSDSTYLLIGNSFDLITNPNSNWPDSSSIFYMKVNDKGDILLFKLLPGIQHDLIIFTDALSYTVLKNNNGDWIISGGVVRLLDSQGLYFDIIPFSVSVSPNFDSLRWITYFSELSFDASQNYDLAATCWATDSSGFVVLARNFKQVDRTTYLTKITPGGDTLWTRHYIPLGFEHEQLSWANMEDIKATPHNTYVMAGTFFDRDRYIRRPWIMHVDSMGCLIPGCDKIVSVDHSNNKNNNGFLIHPNPVGDILYIMCNMDFPDRSPIQLSIISMDGLILQSTMIQPQIGGQYILPVYNIPSGAYLIQMVQKCSSFHQTIQIFKL